MLPLDCLVPDHEPITYGPVLLSRARGVIRFSSQRGRGEGGPFASARLNTLFRRCGARESLEGDAFVVEPEQRAELRAALGRMAAGRFASAEIGPIIAYLDGREPPDALDALGPFLRQFAADLVKALNEGELPWRKPWTSAVPHQNAITRRRYRGMNVMVLTWWAARHGLRSPFWCTAKQVARHRGARLQPGAEPAEIACAIPIEWGLDPWSSPEAPVQRPTRFAPRTYQVFNLEQVDGIAPPELLRPDLPPDLRAEGAATDYLRRGGPTLAPHPDRAFYDARADGVFLPDRQQFDSSEDYYGTLFHELVHSTGHRVRLDRRTMHQVVRFGEPSYAEEELIAEIGAALMLAELDLGADPRPASLAYCQGWAARARADFPMVRAAMNQAQRAVSLILGRGPAPGVNRSAPVEATESGATRR